MSDNNPEPLPSTVIKSRTAFLSQGMKVLSIIAIGELLVILAMAVVISGLLGRPIEVQYLGLTEDMRAIPLPSTREPYLDITKVQTFGEDRLRRSFKWGYRDFQQSWADMERDFTNTGFLSWTQAQQTARLDFVRKNELNLQYRLDSMMAIAAGEHQGVYRWRYEVRGALIYSASGRADRVEPLDIIMDIVRSDPRRNGLGLAIDIISERPGSR